MVVGRRSWDWMIERKVRFLQDVRCLDVCISVCTADSTAPRGAEE